MNLRDTVFHKRLSDDHWWDEVRIVTIPRYKMSGLSGDEWRVSARLQILRKGVIFHERSFSKLEGIDGKTVLASWVPRGWITGDRTSNEPGAAWVFRDHHVEALIRSHSHAFDWRKMRPGKWRSLAETLDRADPWLTLDQAATALGVKTGSLQAHCAKGWMRCERRFEKFGAQRGRIVIRRSWLAEFRWRKPELVGHLGRGHKQRGEAA